MTEQEHVRKKSIAGLLRVIATVKEEITYETKSHYGGPELVYVTSGHKDALFRLTGKKTLTKQDVQALKDLGFTFKRDLKEQSTI